MAVAELVLQSVSFADALRERGFCPSRYRALHADLADLSDDAALRHFASQGILEARSAGLRIGLDDLWPIASDWLGRGALTDAARLLLCGEAADHQSRNGRVSRGEVGRLAPVSARLAAAGFRQVAVIGDSSGANLTSRQAAIAGRYLPIWTMFGGVSASDLGREARTCVPGLLDRARNMREVMPDAPHILKFGQVDLECTYFYRLAEGALGPGSADAGAFVEASVDDYRKFLARYAETVGVTPVAASTTVTGYADALIPVGCSYAPVVESNSTLSPDAMRATLSAMELPNEAARMAMHVRWNDLLRAAAARDGFGFVDVFSPLLTEAGAPDRFYWGEGGGRDIHLDAGRAGRTLGPVLGALLDR